MIAVGLGLPARLFQVWYACLAEGPPPDVEQTNRLRVWIILGALTAVGGFSLWLGRRAALWSAVVLVPLSVLAVVWISQYAARFLP